MAAPTDASQKANIKDLKEFYLKRLAQSEPSAAARLGAPAKDVPAVDPAQPQATGQNARPTFASGASTDIGVLEIMCNNCFNLIPSTEAANHGPGYCCPIATGAQSSAIEVLDLKLQKLRVALEGRLQDSSAKLNVMRHLTQLKYHIDTALKWSPGCSEIGALSDHTVQQVKQLTSTSRVLAPAAYIFSKRIENVVVQKEREIRRVLVQSLPSNTPGSAARIMPDLDRDESVADVNSIVTDLDSNCGTQYAETVVTQDGSAADVGNVQDANDYLSLKNEDEQRRWFYSQCLTAKLACSDKARARKTLISDLYSKVLAEGVPIERWVQWIREQLMPDDVAGEPERRGAAAAASGGERQSARTAMPTPAVSLGRSQPP